VSIPLSKELPAPMARAVTINCSRWGGPSHPALLVPFSAPLSRAWVPGNGGRDVPRHPFPGGSVPSEPCVVWARARRAVFSDNELEDTVSRRWCRSGFVPRVTAAKGAGLGVPGYCITVGLLPFSHGHERPPCRTCARDGRPDGDTGGQVSEVAGRSQRQGSPARRVLDGTGRGRRGPAGLDLDVELELGPGVRVDIDSGVELLRGPVPHSPDGDAAGVGGAGAKKETFELLPKLSPPIAATKSRMPSPQRSARRRSP
jgi:hypothetical protein